MRDHVRFDRGLWDDITQKMADVGMNLLVIDLGDGVLWDSHTEITVEGAWSRDEMKQELARLRGLGLEPIPKLNFSTAHDAWLKEYSRMVSTPKYYEVCSHLVEEVVDLFDTPRLFHLGMDEETAHHQRHFAYAVMRQHELWWHDLHFLVGEVEKHDARPWVWSDYVWLHPGEFFREMPKSVLQSNWYYAEAFDDLENEPEGRRSAVENLPFSGRARVRPDSHRQQLAKRRELRAHRCLLPRTRRAGAAAGFPYRALVADPGGATAEPPGGRRSGGGDDEPGGMINPTVIPRECA